MDLLHLLIVACLPLVGFQIGSVVGEFYDPPPWLLGATLHAAAGVALAVVALELTPRSLAVGPAAPTLLAFGIGAALSLLLLRFSTRIRRLSNMPKGALAVYGVALADLFGDGLMTGAGGAVATGLALLLAGSQVVANIPSGFAATATLKDRCAPAPLRLGLAAAMALPTLAGALIGFFALRGQTVEVQALALAAVAGLLLTATVEDLIPQADKPQSPRAISTAALAGGFILFAGLARLTGA